MTKVTKKGLVASKTLDQFTCTFHEVMGELSSSEIQKLRNFKMWSFKKGQKSQKPSTQKGTFPFSLQL